ncbi:MAG: outer membrane protein assembly factor BamA [Candidatus Omnitrophica bacterium]|nr:outer membrane protein assembly factor BamA [Candidatus Omnitrophota bacterium]
MGKREKKKILYIIGFAIVCMGAYLCMGSNVCAQQTEESEQEDYLPEEDYLPYVSDVVVTGNYIVSSNTIINKIQTQKGNELSHDVINEDIKRLYGTGYFQDVRFDLIPDGTNFSVVVVVDEKSVVEKIIIQGNETIKETTLQKVLGSKEGQILDPHVLKGDIAKIRKKYLDKGFKFVSIDSDIQVDKRTKAATVTIIIDEGQKFKITDIRFDGATAFKTHFLKKRMKTKKRALWLWRTGVFKEKNFQADIERLTYLYQKEGYLDVAMAPEYEYAKKDNTMVIVIVVDEGKQYITGDVQIVGNRIFVESEIWGKLEMLPGEVYSQVRMQNELDSLRRFYFERGYINARIDPETNLNKATGRVDIKYKIIEGDLYFVDKVSIRGNTKTKDTVIRRELRVRPGEQFDGEKLEYSKTRLNNLGFFEEVSYETEPGTAADKRDVVFNVTEKQTGELSFGAGISSIDQFMGFSEIAQRNFDIMKWPRLTGGGQSVSLKARVGSVTRDLDFTFVEPYILNKPVSMGINVYNWEREGNNLDFDTRRRGIGLTFGKNFSDRVKGFVGYTIESVKLTDISADAHADVLASGEENTLSRVKTGIVYDSRDNVFTPTAGWYLSSSAEMIGGVVGGDQDYYNLQAGATKFYSFKKDHVFEFRNRVGFTNDFGDSSQVPVFDRFFAGGLGTVRGYNYRRVGPTGGGDPIGGESLFLSSLEYVFPLIENFKGTAFIDVGHVNYEFFKMDTGDIAVSIGPGLRVNTPLGPITFYYGFPVANKDDKDKNGRFEFNLSRGF